MYETEIKKVLMSIQNEKEKEEEIRNKLREYATKSTLSFTANVINNLIDKDFLDNNDDILSIEFDYFDKINKPELLTALKKANNSDWNLTKEELGDLSSWFCFTDKISDKENVYDVNIYLFTNLLKKINIDVKPRYNKSYNGFIISTSKKDLEKVYNNTKENNYLDNKDKKKYTK